jgi:hypothetical protein
MGQLGQTRAHRQRARAGVNVRVAHASRVLAMASSPWRTLKRSIQSQYETAMIHPQHIADEVNPAT